MELIYGDCGSGKTKEILKLSQDKNIPILCESKERKERLVEKAKGYGYQIPTPIVFNEDHKNIHKVLIDDPKRLIEAMYGYSLEGISINVSEKDVVKL